MVNIAVDRSTSLGINPHASLANPTSFLSLFGGSFLLTFGFGNLFPKQIFKYFFDQVCDCRHHELQQLQLLWFLRQQLPPLGQLDTSKFDDGPHARRLDKFEVFVVVTSIFVRVHLNINYVFSHYYTS